MESPSGSEEPFSIEALAVQLAPAGAITDLHLATGARFGGGCTSNAPMSLPSPDGALLMAGSSIGRGKPRWSMLSREWNVRLPRSIAGLWGSSACVKVGPPL